MKKKEASITFEDTVLEEKKGMKRTRARQYRRRRKVHAALTLPLPLYAKEPAFNKRICQANSDFIKAPVSSRSARAARKYQESCDATAYVQTVN